MTDPKDRGHDPGSATPGPGTNRGDTPEPLRVSARDKAFLNAAAEIEATPAWDAGTVGYTSSLWAEFSLPYRDPGDVSRWERINGNRHLILRPAVLDDGEGYPYGVYPRLILSHLATQAVLTRNPNVSVGSSLNAFIDSLGLPRAGSTNLRVKNQLARLLGSDVLVKETIKRTDRGRLTHDERFALADGWALWVPASDDITAAEAEADAGEDVPQFTSTNRMVWPDTVKLTAAFYSDLTDGGAVPVDLRALRALAPWPMAMDIYVWLTWRMFRLSRAAARNPGKRPPITWAQLAGQFGSQHSRERRFRTEFVKLLDTRVHSLYPAADYHHDERGLFLYPSPPHVAPLAPVAASRRPSRPTTRKPESGRCPEHGMSLPCSGCRADRLAKKEG